MALTRKEAKIIVLSLLRDRLTDNLPEAIAKCVKDGDFSEQEADMINEIRLEKVEELKTNIKFYTK